YLEVAGMRIPIAVEDDPSSVGRYIRAGVDRSCAGGCREPPLVGAVGIHDVDLARRRVLWPNRRKDDLLAVGGEDRGAIHTAGVVRQPGLAGSVGVHHVDLEVAGMRRPVALEDDLLAVRREGG